MTTSRRKFLKPMAPLAGAATLAAPAVFTRQSAPIKWRLQTYAGPALGDQVIDTCIKHFNEIAKGQMEIELYYADQLVPTGELFRAMQKGTIDAVQSDDDFDGLADRGDGVRRLFPARPALLARRAGAVQPLGSRRDLEGGIRQGRGQAHLGRLVGPLQLRHPQADHSRSTTSRACASSPSRPPAASCRASA